MIHLVDVRLDHPSGGEPLVEGANLEVARGEVVVIVGAAGVGTSRLAAAALGEVPIAAGRIEVLGRDVAKLRRASLRLLRRRIGIVPQDLCLLEDRSAQLNVALPLEIDGFPRSLSLARAGEALARLDLEAHALHPVESLSASARQRVAVARALVRDPELIIADHPTSLQDAVGAELVCSALADSGAATVILGRDPALRAIADSRRWRQLGLMCGTLRPLGEIDGDAVDELLFDVITAPTPLHAVDDAIPNVVPFPIAGVA